MDPGIDPSGDTRARVEALLRDPAVSVAEIARASAPALLAALGVKRDARRPIEDASPPRRLRALLRAHIGRQITAFDAALADPRAGMDSAKVLRDLGGLKRLLDDLGDGSADEGTGEGESRDAPAHHPGETILDIEGLRAQIARRYERFVDGGAAD